MSIDGILDAGYQAINYKGTKVNGIAGNGSSTSQINFRGTEDLGGGMKADFRVETDWNTVSNKGNTGAGNSDATKVAASSFGNGELRVGLAGGFGRVDLGAVNYNTLGTYFVGQPFGTAIGSGFRAVFVNDTQTTSSVRADNAVKYTSPTFSGLNVTLYKSNKQAHATSSATNFSASLGAYQQQGTSEVGVNYANGPIAASYSTLTNDWSSVVSSTFNEQKVNTLAAKYTFGAASVSLLNQTNKKNDNSFNTSITTVSGTYTMGNTVLMAQVGSLKADANTVSSVSYAGKSSKLSALGVDYNLSKRTAVYARYESINDEAKVIAAAATVDGSDTKRTRTAIGLRHAF